MEKGKHILAIETAVGQGSLSLLKDGEAIGSRLGKSQVTRSSDLIAEISALLDESGVSKSEIGLLAVSIGPGSYTGARIGIATAKGLGDALNCPCVGVSMLKALAVGFAGFGTICSVLPAGGDSFYFQFFALGNSPEAGESEIFAGNGEFLCESFVNNTPAKIILEKSVSDQIRVVFDEETSNFDLETASDNLAVYIARLADGKKLSEIKNSQIEPLYVKEEKYRRLQF